MPSPIWIPSPDELRKLRLRAGISQRELARRAGVSQSLIARLEKGEVNIRLTTLQKILRVLYDALADEDRAEHYMTSPVISVKTGTSLREVAALMDSKGISQIPVIDENNRVIGTIYETTLLRILLRNGESFLDKKVEDVMEDPLPIVSPSTPIYIVQQILVKYPAVLVIDKGEIRGIITKIDIIRHKLRREA